MDATASSTDCNKAEKSNTEVLRVEVLLSCRGSSIDGLFDDGRGVSGFVRVAIKLFKAAPCSPTHSNARVMRQIVPILVVGKLRLDAASCSLDTKALLPIGPAAWAHDELLGYCEEPCVLSDDDMAVWCVEDVLGASDRLLVANDTELAAARLPIPAFC